MTVGMVAGGIVSLCVGGISSTLSQRARVRDERLRARREFLDADVSAPRTPEARVAHLFIRLFFAAVGIVASSVGAAMIVASLIKQSLLTAMIGAVAAGAFSGYCSFFAGARLGLMKR